jgi:glycosyltransferase involved in cell wall biosynthesis
MVETREPSGSPSPPLVTTVDQPPEVSIVMPCLNEADTLEACIRKAQAAIATASISAEVIVADNGSTDASRDIARALGARVVDVSAKGYGSALMGGIAAARGRYVIMGDADDSYDFGEVPKFVAKLREGFDLVQGCRLPRGGGTVKPGAMPFSHRWLGNPGFTALVRTWFRAPVNDVYCGMRGFTKELYERLDQRCTGMEFATEMIIKSSLMGERIAEVPITLYPDGRKSHPPHLKTVRDGWRTLRFFMMYSPRWLYFLPGLLCVLLGVLGYALALPATRIGGVTFDAHTLLFASLAILCGHQAILFGVFAKTFAMAEHLVPSDPAMMRLFKLVNLERGLVASAVAMLAGLALLFTAVLQWRATGYGRLDYAHSMRIVIPGATLTALGFQTFLSSFFISILGMARR